MALISFHVRHNATNPYEFQPRHTAARVAMNARVKRLMNTALHS
ncbi:hypothetical protein E2C01_098162 [Portunus trituberculatus]|uniref:Uncharacterized protein n=1 Tax=Portunus trituberculatus TaxID=210409 RepID=A0A5B7K0J6_PORTR|nr:hypothetical protein [Portunus trituberculatus]